MPGRAPLPRCRSHRSSPRRRGAWRSSNARFAVNPAMDAEAIEAYVDAASVVLGLPLAAGHRPGVLRYFAMAASMAELVNSQPLDLTDEPATVFTPISPPADGRIGKCI